MNNFHNQYVDPESYQGLSYPDQRHFSFKNQEGTLQNERQQNQKKSDPAKQSNDTNGEKENKISKPVLFPPPTVDTIQLPLNEDLSSSHTRSKGKENEKNKKKANYELVEKFSNMLDDTSSIHERYPPSQEDYFQGEDGLEFDESTTAKQYRKKANSEKLADDFLSMLEEESDNLFSIDEESDLFNKKENIFENQFIALLSESDEVQEEVQHSETYKKSMNPLHGKDDHFAEKVCADLLEDDDLQEEEVDRSSSNEEMEDVKRFNETVEDQFLKLLVQDEAEQEIEEESVPVEKSEVVNGADGDKPLEILLESPGALEEEEDSYSNNEASGELKEASDEMEDKFLTMLSKSDDTQEEKEENLEQNIEEPESKEIEDFSGKAPFYKKKPKKYCIHKHPPKKATFLKNRKSKHFFCKNNHLEKKKNIIAKMPVLLAKLDAEVDLNETIDLAMPLKHIVKVEWSIQSFDCNIVLPSRTAFLNGEFIADIECQSNKSGDKTQLLKVSIPWSKTATVDWIGKPELPYNHRNEWTFHSLHEPNLSTHFESLQKLSEPICSKLKQFNFIWHQELYEKNKKLQVNGVARLFIHFMQEQFIELDSCTV